MKCCRTIFIMLWLAGGIITHCAAQTGQNTFVEFPEVSSSFDWARLKTDFETDSLGYLGLRFSRVDNVPRKWSEDNLTDSFLDYMTVRYLNKRMTKFTISGIDLTGKHEYNIIPVLGQPNKTERWNTSNNPSRSSVSFATSYFYYLSAPGYHKRIKTFVITVYNELIIDTNVYDTW